MKQIVFDGVWVGVSLETGITVLTWGHSRSSQYVKPNEEETFVVISTSRYQNQHCLVDDQLRRDDPHWPSPPDPEGVVSSPGREGDTMGVTLKDMKELSNPSAPLKDQFFIGSTNIDRWTRVSDINGEAREKEEDEARRREQEKRDREEREKQRLDTVAHLLRVRCPVCFAFVSMI
jgi:hypothetical protein